MASIRKRSDNWQAQVRLAGSSPITKSFPFKKDGVHWAKAQESKFRSDDYAQLDERSINSTVGECWLGIPKKMYARSGVQITNGL